MQTKMQLVQSDHPHRCRDFLVFRVCRRQFPTFLSLWGGEFGLVRVPLQVNHAKGEYYKYRQLITYRLLRGVGGPHF